MKRLQKRLAQLEAKLRYGATKFSKSQLFAIIQQILVVEAAIASNQAARYENAHHWACCKIAGRYIPYSEIQVSEIKVNPFLPAQIAYCFDGKKVSYKEVCEVSYEYAKSSDYVAPPVQGNGYTYLDFAYC